MCEGLIGHWCHGSPFACVRGWLGTGVTGRLLHVWGADWALVSRVAFCMCEGLIGHWCHGSPFACVRGWLGTGVTGRLLHVWGADWALVSRVAFFLTWHFPPFSVISGGKCWIVRSKSYWVPAISLVHSSDSTPTACLGPLVVFSVSGSWNGEFLSVLIVFVKCES